MPCHRIDVIESKRGDGTFPDLFCGDSEHQKWVETAKPRRIHGTRSNIRVSSAQQSVGAVGSGSIWEMPVDILELGIALRFVRNFIL